MRANVTLTPLQWLEGKLRVTGEKYTALVDTANNQELGRYWHRATGYVPDTVRNNAKARETEAEARRAVVMGVLDRMKVEMGHLGKVLGAIDIEEAQPQPAAREQILAVQT